MLGCGKIFRTSTEGEWKVEPKTALDIVVHPDLEESRTDGLRKFFA